MNEAVKLIAAVCLVPPGHEKVLEAITEMAEMEQQERFAPIVEGLKVNDNALRISCMQLINALLSSYNEDLDFRLHLRNEFLRCGFYDIWDSLNSQENDHSRSAIFSADLSTQLKVFNDAKDEDFDELSQRFENVRFDLEDVSECFELIKNAVKSSPAEPYFLSVLQHLLLIRDDYFAR